MITKVWSWIFAMTSVVIHAITGASGTTIHPREKPALEMMAEIATKVMMTMQRVMIDVMGPPLS
jgi:nitric oxide reductase large subunit